MMGLDGLTWERLSIVGLPDDITNGGFSTSLGHIAINNKGQIHIAAQTRAPWEGNGSKPTVYRFNGSRWDVVGSGPVSDHAFETLLISFSSTGEPIVAAQNKVQTQVFAYIQSEWHTMAAGAVTNPGTLISMDVSKDDVPYLGFSSSADNGAPVVFKWSFDPQDR